LSAAPGGAANERLNETTTIGSRIEHGAIQATSGPAIRSVLEAAALALSRVGRRVLPDAWQVDILLLLLVGLLLGAAACYGLLAVSTVPTPNPAATDLRTDEAHDTDVLDLRRERLCCRGTR
jgi:hypothetical protein